MDRHNKIELVPRESALNSVYEQSRALRSGKIPYEMLNQSVNRQVRLIEG